MLSQKITRLSAIVLACFLVVLIGVGCSADKKEGSGSQLKDTQSSSSQEEVSAGAYQTISAADAKRMMEEESSYILLDVRTEEEFDEKHIEGALLIPDYEIAQRAEAELPNKDELLLVYCRSGRRSALAAQELSRLGYANVYDFGGINDWPYETVDG